MPSALCSLEDTVKNRHLWAGKQVLYRHWTSRHLDQLCSLQSWKEPCFHCLTQHCYITVAWQTKTVIKQALGCLLRCSIQKTDAALVAAGGKWTQRVQCFPALHLPFPPTSCLHSSGISSCRSVSLTLPLQRRAWSTMGPNNRMGCTWKSNQTPSSLFPPAPRVTFSYKLISGNFSRCRHWSKWNIFHCKFPYCLGYFICLKLLYF